MATLTAYEETRHHLRNIFNNDLFLFCKLLYKDVNRTTHKPICDAIMADTRRKLFCLPRGSFKSSIISIATPIWLLNRDPNTRIMLDSEVYTNSKNLLREIRSHLESTKLTAIWGDYRSNTWSEGELTIKQRKQVYKEASLTCSGIETTKVGQHYNWIIADDMNSDKNSGTQEGRQKVIDHYRMLTSILEPDGTLCVVGTRYASNDLIGWVLDNEIAVKKPGLI